MYLNIKTNATTTTTTSNPSNASSRLNFSTKKKHGKSLIFCSYGEQVLCSNSNTFNLLRLGLKSIFAYFFCFQNLKRRNKKIWIPKNNLQFQQNFEESFKFWSFGKKTFSLWILKCWNYFWSSWKENQRLFLAKPLTNGECPLDRVFNECSAWPHLLSNWKYIS